MARIPVPEHKTVTGIYYAEQVLPVVVNHYMATRPRTCVRGLKLLHDNAPAHCSAVVQDCLKTDLKLYHIPRTVQIWHHVTAGLSGRKFETRTAVGRALFQCTDSIHKCDYKSALKTWIKRLKKCVEVKGEYFEELEKSNLEW